MSNKIEGVPDGWRLVAIRRVKNGEWFIERGGRIELWREPDDEKSCWVHPIIEKIEQTKQYRPFDNAKEFEPHRDRWIKHPDAEDRKFKVIMFDDCGVCCYERRYSYAHLFECGTVFADGSPFGVEVTE